MEKLDLNGIVESVKKSIKDKRKDSIKLGNEMKPLSNNKEDYIILPEKLEWEFITGGLLGLPFGKLIQIAGDSDTGKTSFAITAMKAAQEQDVAVLYVETEGKTSKNDLENWGVDTENVMLVQSSVAEEAFTSMFDLWEAFFKKYPGRKLLVIVDSWGNTISLRDEGIDIINENQKPGGQAKTNRLAINKMIAKIQKQDKVALLIINYTYDNIGSIGKTNAGGKAIHFFTYVGFQTKRLGWLDKTVNGEKVRYGARVRWSYYKNHAAKGNESVIPHHIDFIIDAEGMRYDDSKKESIQE